MREIAEFVAVLSCSLFMGASVYINLVEHPARMECGVEIAATEFAPSYRRATIMQASSAALGLLSSIAAWLAVAALWWLGARVHLGRVTRQSIAEPLSCRRVRRLWDYYPPSRHGSPGRHSGGWLLEPFWAAL